MHNLHASFFTILLVHVTALLACGKFNFIISFSSLRATPSNKDGWIKLRYFCCGALGLTSPNGCIDEAISYHRLHALPKVTAIVRKSF